MSWIDNLISYCKSGDSGKCPTCGSADVSVEEHVHGTRKSLSFVCKKCRATDHFDGMANENME